MNCLWWNDDTNNGWYEYDKWKMTSTNWPLLGKPSNGISRHKLASYNPHFSILCWRSYCSNSQCRYSSNIFHSGWLHSAILGNIQWTEQLLWNHWKFTGWAWPHIVSLGSQQSVQCQFSAEIFSNFVHKRQVQAKESVKTEIDRRNSKINTVGCSGT